MKTYERLDEGFVNWILFPLCERADECDFFFRLPLPCIVHIYVFVKFLFRFREFYYTIEFLNCQRYLVELRQFITRAHRIRISVSIATECLWKLQTHTENIYKETTVRTYTINKTLRSRVDLHLNGYLEADSIIRIYHEPSWFYL